MPNIISTSTIISTSRAAIMPLTVYYQHYFTGRRNHHRDGTLSLTKSVIPSSILLIIIVTVTKTIVIIGEGMFMMTMLSLTMIFFSSSFKVKQSSTRKIYSANSKGGSMKVITPSGTKSTVQGQTLFVTEEGKKGISWLAS